MQQLLWYFPPLRYKIVCRKSSPNMYADGTTSLGHLGAVIILRRGFKQGDPYSPLLNLVLDPFLQELQLSTDGFRVANQQLAVMAYVDDVTLFSGSPEGMSRLLQSTSDYLVSFGMSLTLAKCGAFSERLGDAWVSRPVNLAVQGSPIKAFVVDERFAYLRATLTIGFDNRHHLDALRQSAERVRHLSLKPHQKVKLLMQYVVPSFAYRLTLDPPSGNDLNRKDTALRGAVKKILHLVDYIHYGWPALLPKAGWEPRFP